LPFHSDKALFRSLVSLDIGRPIRDNHDAFMIAFV
jgi:hypothetical protein